MDWPDYYKTDEEFRAAEAKLKAEHQAAANGKRGNGAEPPNNGATADAKRAVRAELIALENLKMEPIDWIWDKWLARGKIHLIAGVPEAGKTTDGLSLCATVSSGGRWPDGTKAAPGNVLIWSGEDGLAETIKPRLVAMGADPKRIWIVRGALDETGKLRPFNPQTDLPALALVAKEIPGGVDLLVVDPIVSVIGGKVDNGNNAGHREKLQPLVDFAEEMKCAVIGITHFTKGTIGKDPIDRVTGSLAFAAVARVVLVATKNKGGDPERMFIMVKNNLAPTVGGYGYSIVGAPLTERPDIIASRIVWGERLEGSARDLLAEAEDDGKAASGSAEASQSVQAFLETALTPIRGGRKRLLPRVQSGVFRRTGSSAPLRRWASLSGKMVSAAANGCGACRRRRSDPRARTHFGSNLPKLWSGQMAKSLIFPKIARTRAIDLKPAAKSMAKSPFIWKNATSLRVRAHAHGGNQQTRHCPPLLATRRGRDRDRADQSPRVASQQCNLGSFPDHPRFERAAPPLDINPRNDFMLKVNVTIGEQNGNRKRRRAGGSFWRHEKNYCGLGDGWNCQAGRAWRVRPQGIGSGFRPVHARSWRR